MLTENNAIGKRFRKRREEMGYSQRALAEAMQVSRSHIQCIEDGDNFSVAVLLEACRVLEISPNEMLDQEDDRAPYMVRYADVLRNLSAKEMEVITSAAEGMKKGFKEE